MTFKCYINEYYVGKVYAANSNSALMKAMQLYGPDVEIEEI